MWEEERMENKAEEGPGVPTQEQPFERQRRRRVAEEQYQAWMLSEAESASERRGRRMRIAHSLHTHTHTHTILDMIAGMNINVSVNPQGWNRALCGTDPLFVLAPFSVCCCIRYKSLCRFSLVLHLGGNTAQPLCVSKSHTSLWLELAVNPRLLSQLVSVEFTAPVRSF